MFAHDRGTAKERIGYAFKDKYSQYSNGIFSHVLQSEGWSEPSVTKQQKVDLAVKASETLLGLNIVTECPPLVREWTKPTDGKVCATWSDEGTHISDQIRCRE
jgi:hypothetical protein